MYTPQIILEMCESRGYRPYSVTETLIKVHDVDSDIYIWLLYERCTAYHYRSILTQMKQNAIYHGIIVHSGPLSHIILKNIQLEFDIEFFLWDELAINVTKHSLVPRHIKLESQEAMALVKKMGIHFPVLLKTDIIARYYRFVKGDVIKILRPDEISYRKVE